MLFSGYGKDYSKDLVAEFFKRYLSTRFWQTFLFEKKKKILFYSNLFQFERIIWQNNLFIIELNCNV